MKNLLLILFVARVLIPMHVTVYENVESWRQFSNEIYILNLSDGRQVIAPTMWTIIEEKKDK